jgi:ketosteroid isomerase-like protein
MRISRIALVLVLVPFLALISCSQQAGEEAQGQAMEMAMSVSLEELGESIATMHTQFIEAYEGEDGTAIAQMFTEDGMRMEPNMEMVRGRAAVEAAMTAQFDMIEAPQLTIETIDFGTSGDLAYDIGTYTVSYEMGGAVNADEGKYVVVMKLGPDGWKILTHIFSSSLPEEGM